MNILIVLLAALLGPSPVAGFFNSCPKIDTVDLDIDSFVEKTWYIQRQQTTAYQPAENLFCVTATYALEGAKQYWKDAITVRNYANKGGVNGPSGGGNLCATIKAPGKLVVAPCFLPSHFGGPYWVAAVASDYSWAIIVAGQPNVRGRCGDANLCTTREPSFLSGFGNGEGLWFFTRAQVADQTTLATLEATAAGLGICTAKMLPVVQSGCTYTGSNHKN
jgi:lipocalin